MRRKREPLTDRPGTISVGRKGRCVSCCNITSAYGLSIERWHEMLVEQAGRCAVCTDPMRVPHVDHDHASGVVRALLCSPCNIAEGQLKGNPQRARALADYMERHLNVF